MSDGGPALGDEARALSLAPHRFGPDLEDAHVAVCADRPFDILRRTAPSLDPFREFRERQRLGVVDADGFRVRSGAIGISLTAPEAGSKRYSSD